jgi:hypothetical protein
MSKSVVPTPCTGNIIKLFRRITLLSKKLKAASDRKLDSKETIAPLFYDLFGFLYVCLPVDSIRKSMFCVWGLFKTRQTTYK